MAWLGTLSYDVAAQSTQLPAINAAVVASVGQRKTWQLLSRQWLLSFSSIDDFKAFAAQLETLHTQHAKEFDYFAVLFNPQGGPVIVAPDPDVRMPKPVAALDEEG
jgi:hypothetical protein